MSLRCWKPCSSACSMMEGVAGRATASARASISAVSASPAGSDAALTKRLMSASASRSKRETQHLAGDQVAVPAAQLVLVHALVDVGDEEAATVCVRALPFRKQRNTRLSLPSR